MRDGSFLQKPDAEKEILDYNIKQHLARKIPSGEVLL